MDYRVIYTQRALNDYDEILTYIALDDSTAASRFGESLRDHTALLAQFPRLGSKIGDNLRGLTHSPVIVYYVVHDERRVVEIVHIRHASRDVPSF